MRLRRPLLFLFAALLAALPQQWGRTQDRTLRPPAVPLVACDPYFSVWSCADHLTDDVTRHWTRTVQPLTSMVRIDGKAYRLMGAEPKEIPPLPQFALSVTPTRSMYEFKNEQVRLFLTFMTPALPEDLDLVSRPVTYLTWEAGSEDGRPHQVSIYARASALLAVNAPDQKVAWSREKIGRLTALRVGTEDQPVLQKKGDNLRIDWGYLYQAGAAKDWKQAAGSRTAAATAFVASGGLPSDTGAMPRPAGQDEPTLSAVTDLGRVREGLVSRHLTLAYDDGYSITLMGRKLRPYWRRNGMDAAGLLERSEREYAAILQRCERFDRELTADLQRAGGDRYAQIAALAYRQCFAANKIAADANGRPLLFPKENFSNGCIATVDVIYPMDPLFLLFSPTLAKASLAPVLAYAASPRWKWPFAPHDLGTYPIANGQVYGGGERTEENQMPVEESGNMLLLLAALAKQEGDAGFASAYWPQLTRWAKYLEAKGFDPENQLCTDDFAGHLAHNVNLSVKAIEALGAYGLLCEMRGDRDSARRYHDLAAGLAKKWIAAADDGDPGDHFRLAFDRPGTWSQKYNLVWDRILGLDLFPEEVVRKELAYYRKVTNRYGLPLDNRQNYTKLDWTIWTATLTSNRTDWDALVNPVFDFLNDTPDRVPMTDWYRTKEPRIAGFQARSVVGGVFIKLLSDPAVWKKWASRDRTPEGEWAPLPMPPQVTVVVPTSRDAAQTWRYTTDRQEGDWYGAAFDASGWKEGPGGFGTRGTPGSAVRTVWNSPDIWLRREFTLAEGRLPGLQLLAHHDEDLEVYLNGVLAAKIPGYTTDYETFPIRPEARATLKPGRNVIAVHCHQTGGGQYVDVGLAEVREPD